MYANLALAISHVEHRVSKRFLIRAELVSISVLEFRF